MIAVRDYVTEGQKGTDQYQKVKLFRTQRACALGTIQNLAVKNIDRSGNNLQIQQVVLKVFQYILVWIVAIVL